MKNFGEKETWTYPGTAQFFRVPPIISGTGKDMKFKFCMHIYRLNRNKSPLKISGKVPVGIVRDSRNFSGHTYGTSRGHLWDSSAYLFSSSINQLCHDHIILYKKLRYRRETARQLRMSILRLAN